MHQSAALQKAHGNSRLPFRKVNGAFDRQHPDEIGIGMRKIQLPVYVPSIADRCLRERRIATADTLVARRPSGSHMQLDLLVRRSIGRSKHGV
jgi:hypothetical protein